MKRLLPITAICFGATGYLFGLCLYAPREVFVLMWLPSLVLLALAFDREKARIITAIGVAAVSAAFAATPIDLRMVHSQKSKGIYFLPIDYGIVSRSVDQGYCPGGCIIDRRAPTHAVVLSL